MRYISVDVEADAQSPAIGSMVCFGAVLVGDMNTSFYGETAPITNEFTPSALAISGFSRVDHIGFDDPAFVMEEFRDWISRVTDRRPIFICDNPAFDWQWINYYFHLFLGDNPFGWSARRIGDLWCGMEGDSHARWKHLRKTKHTHNPVDDAMGNAEVLHIMKERGLKIKF